MWAAVTAVLPQCTHSEWFVKMQIYSEWNRSHTSLERTLTEADKYFKWEGEPARFQWQRLNLTSVSSICHTDKLTAFSVFPCTEHAVFLQIWGLFVFIQITSIWVKAPFKTWKAKTGWVKLYRSRTRHQHVQLPLMLSCPCRFENLSPDAVYLHHNRIFAQIKDQYIFFTIWE